jgi:ATP-dependent Clp protease adaptor protein ClpS
VVAPHEPVSHNPGVSQTIEMPVRVREPEREDERELDRPWIVVVWNDPVNLMTYVTFVFQKLFGYSLEKAEELMLQVHHEGKAVVSDGTREKAEADVARLHAHGLWATMEQN